MPRDRIYSPSTVRDGVEKMGHRITMGIHEIPKDIVLYENIMEYMSVKMRVYYSHDQQPDMNAYLRECSDFLTKNKSEQVYQRATAGDPASRVECALRYLSACGMRRKSWDGALTTLDSVTNPQDKMYKRGTDRETIARALSCTAHAYFEKYQCPADHLHIMQEDEKRFERPKPPFGSNLGYLYLAAQYADASARRGLVSPIVLSIGFYIYRLGDQSKSDLTETPLFQNFTELWRVCQERQTEIFMEERRRLNKIRKKPNAYTCAADGCGVKAAKAAAFASCAGPCPSDIKPHYCSKACQVKDWATHKQICKPGAKATKSEALVLYEGGLKEEGRTLTLEEEDLSVRDAGIAVEMPEVNGKKMTLIANNISPEFLKEMRDGSHEILAVTHS